MDSFPKVEPNLNHSRKLKHNERPKSDYKRHGQDERDLEHNDDEHFSGQNDDTLDKNGGTLFISNAPSAISDVHGQRECALRAAAARWFRRLPPLLSLRLRCRHRPYLHLPLLGRVRPQNYSTARGC